MDDALNILSQYERIGIKGVWLTPTISEEKPNETSYLRKCFEELQEEYDNKLQTTNRTPVILNLASDNMLDSLLCERLKKHDILPIGMDGKHLLVHMEVAHSPNNMYELVKQVQEAGYVPILAHPERYFYLEHADYHKLRKDMGVSFQMSIQSLAGMYGPEAKHRAMTLLEKGYYTHVGTDICDIHKFFAAVTEYKISIKHLDVIREIITSTPN